MPSVYKGNLDTILSHLLPTGSEETAVLRVERIPVAILQVSSNENRCIIIQRNLYSGVVKKRNTSKVVLRPQYSPRLSF